MGAHVLVPGRLSLDRGINAVRIVRNLPSNPRSEALGVFLVVVSAFAYGTVPILAKLTFRDGVPLLQFLLLRFAVASALLWIAVVLIDRRMPGRSVMLPLFLMGAIGYTGQSAAFFAALQRIPAATTALLLYTYPAIVTLAAIALKRDRFSARKIVAMIIAFAGTSLVIGGHIAGAAPLGVAFALTSAILYSTYVLVGSRLFAGVPPIAAAATVMTATALSYFTFAVVTGQLSLPENSLQTGMIATIAVVGTAVPVLAFVIGMPRIGPARASILSTFEPAVTVLLAGIVLAEPLKPLQLAGAACVIASVLVLEAGRAGEPARM